MAVVRCRAQVVPECYGIRGISEETVYPDGDQKEDGTYRRASNTVVCDPCYLAVGGPTLAFLEEAVAETRLRQGKEPLL
jgi:hypothetical protein